MIRIDVGLDERGYPIMIQENLLATLVSDLQSRSIAKRYAVIADSHVASLYAEPLMRSFEEKGIQGNLITFLQGEASKNLATLADLASSLANLGIDRKDGLVALGGGVTGDITGFLASSYMRGIPFIQVPTTLLAQVDSSVGGKTGVDIPQGKNLVGSFYQPRCVYIDSRALLTLPKQELLNGLAEVIKYGVIYDRDLFDLLQEQREAILSLDLAILEKIIAICCTIKAKVVEVDEKESDFRRILNFGHTIGHAVEAASDYLIAHGSAVAIGMVAAARLAVSKGMLGRDESERIHELIAAYGLPVRIPEKLNREKIKAYLKTDKKAVSGRPFFVLPTAIGKVCITDDVSEELIDQVL